MANPFMPTPVLRSVEQLIADFAGPLPEQMKMVNLIYSLGQALEPVAVSWDDIEDKPTTFPPVIGDGADEAMAGDTAVVSPAELNARLSAAQRSAIDALVSPTADYADLTEATAAIKSIIDALKA